MSDHIFFSGDGVFAERSSGVVEDEIVSLLSIPADVWPNCIAHADVEALLALPLTCRAMNAAFGTPLVRVKSLEHLLAAAQARDQAFPQLRSRVGEDGDVAPATDEASGDAPELAKGLAARARARQLRGLVRDMTRRAIRAHSAEAMRTCVQRLGFDLAGEMGWVLHQVMRHDFADGVDVALSPDGVDVALWPAGPSGLDSTGVASRVRPTLPFYGTPLKMLPRAIHDLLGRPHVLGDATDEMKSVLR